MSEEKCGCTPDASGYGYCGECRKALHKKIWDNMSVKDKRYDMMQDPAGVSRSGIDACEPEGCSCHIAPPCQWCIDNQGEDD